MDLDRSLDSSLEQRNQWVFCPKSELLNCGFVCLFFFPPLPPTSEIWKQVEKQERLRILSWPYRLCFWLWSYTLWLTSWSLNPQDDPTALLCQKLQRVTGSPCSSSRCSCCHVLWDLYWNIVVRKVTACGFDAESTQYKSSFQLPNISTFIYRYLRLPVASGSCL